jgi:hypothetical protein
MGSFFKHISRVIRYEDMEVSPLLRKPSEQLLDVNLQPCCFRDHNELRNDDHIFVPFFGGNVVLLNESSPFDHCVH